MADEIDGEPSAREVPRVIRAVASVPWAITDEGMEKILAIVTRQNEATPEALEAYRAQRLKDAESLSIDRGIAQMSIQGPLVRYSDFFAAISGATTYQGTMLDLERARTDPTVKAILISIDSPGGEVNGCNELAAAIRSVAAQKPVYAYVGGQAASAAYWLASPASRIIVDETAMLGSIGVRLGIRDTSARDAKSGVRTIEFVSSQSPHKSLNVETEPGRAKMQATVDSLASVFIASVAKYRGVTAEDVIARFGGGGVKVGAEAVEAGMADAIGSFESVKASLIAGQGVRAKANGDFKMSGTQGNVTGQGPLGGAEPIHTQAALDSAVKQARSEGETIGAQQAQQRISAILSSDEAKDRTTLANHLAFKTSVSADEAKTMLAASEKVVAAASQPSGRAKDAAGGLAIADANAKAERDAEERRQSHVAIDSRKIYDKFGGKA